MGAEVRGCAARLAECYTRVFQELMAIDGRVLEQWAAHVAHFRSRMKFF